MKKRPPSRKSLPPSRKGQARAGRGSVIFKAVPPKKSTWKVFAVKRYGRGPLPPNAKRIIAKAKRFSKYKRAQYKKSYNKEFLAELKAAGVPPQGIERAMEFSLTAKIKQRAALRYTRDSKTGRYRVNGRFVSKASFKSSLRMRQYWGTVRGYQSVYGLTLKESRKLYAYLRDEGFGETAFNALY